jgi:hypothetical protein
MKRIYEDEWDSDERAQAKESVEAWWDDAADDQRRFLRNVVGMAEALAPGGVIELSLENRSFVPTLRSGTQSAAEVSAVAAPMMAQEPSAWWGELSDGKKALVREVASMADEVLRDDWKRVELAKTERSLKVTLVLRFKRPVGGKAAAN